jgi:putative nucleotidyltransferase with HDIG domain
MAGMTAGESLPPGMKNISALETWIPVEQNGTIVGAVVVWRDMDAIDAALMRIQLTMTSIILASAVLLWLILRGVYVRSSKRIVAQARALELSLEERERTYDATLEALASALDVRDSETGGHSDRVLQYMELVIEEMDLAGEDRAFLRRGALLHDIGKIGVPDNILRKPAALSEAEWTTMRKHPEFGARIIAGIPFLQDVARIVRHHHERWDGMGYPDRLAGEAIPVGARVFAVADSFDAMTSDRPYRRAMSIAAACDEVLRCRGTQFDPAVVDAFARIPREHLSAVADDAPHTHPVAVAG